MQPDHRDQLARVLRQESEMDHDSATAEQLLAARERMRG